MIDDNSMIDSRQCTFSQAHDSEPLPSILALGELPSEARTRVWNEFWRATTEAIPMPPPGYAGPQFVLGEWQNVLLDVIGKCFQETTTDDITVFDQHYGYVGMSVDYIVEEFKPFILREAPFNKVFDLLQHAMRHHECPPSFTNGIKAVFREGRLAYFVDTNGVPTIFPAVTTHEGKAIERARHALHRASASPAQGHLQRAGELIGDGKWRESVRESVLAVESVAKTLGTDGNTLGKVLAKLKKKKDCRVHPLLLDSLSKLYQYRGSEQGVGHAATNDRERVGKEEAVLLLGACASFCSYLLGRHRGVTKAGQEGSRLR